MRVVTDHGYEFLNLGTGDLSRVVDPEADLAFDHCYNDGKVDPGGRSWVGSLPIAGARGEEITEDTGRLYSLVPDGDVRCHDDGLFVSNGMGWSPGADRMHHIDSWGAPQSVGQLSFQTSPPSNPNFNCPTLCGALQQAAR